MKPDARQVPRLLADPAALRAILLFGEDAGLIRERAAEAVRAAAGTLDDPFRVAVLGRDGHERLDEEAGALSLTGGRRVVWVREATDGVAAALKRTAERPRGALLVIEAPGLASRAKLRTLVEAMPDGAAIGCYPEEGRALEAQVARLLGEQGVGIDPDALNWLAMRLGSDRAAMRGEVEKLVLYAGGDTGASGDVAAGRGPRIGLDDVMACIGDAASSSLEDTAFAAAAGDRAGADAALERSLAEGTSPVAVARALLGHLGRLRQARLLVERSGLGVQEAVRSVRPPVFFKRVPLFAQAVSAWSLDGLARAAERTLALELACKQGGAPDAALCRRHVAILATEARARR
ncbi:MAG: DNA polymerase III subunit delta [Gluconacetobacter diazotrophicus]|nr:DNA polymerase III subunit delta [Gluconacetobacter diazotrophicus]